MRKRDVCCIIDKKHNRFRVDGETLQTDSSESLKVSVERDEKKKQLEKQIAALENKMRREKQLNRQMEMNAELKKLRKNWR